MAEPSRVGGGGALGAAAGAAGALGLALWVDSGELRFGDAHAVATADTKSTESPAE